MNSTIPFFFFLVLQVLFCWSTHNSCAKDARPCSGHPLFEYKEVIDRVEVYHSFMFVFFLIN